mmetsp:Transcript_10720/g.33379  ORF Transcript_10720/g.33379 Transcript_10720/m.33379 type:complete len:247 (+) Transcript_10720:595-1335(+)
MPKELPCNTASPHGVCTVQPCMGCTCRRAVICSCCKAIGLCCDVPPAAGRCCHAALFSTCSIRRSIRFICCIICSSWCKRLACMAFISPVSLGLSAACAELASSGWIGCGGSAGAVSPSDLAGYDCHCACCGTRSDDAGGPGMAVLAGAACTMALSNGPIGVSCGQGHCRGCWSLWSWKKLGAKASAGASMRSGVLLSNADEPSGSLLRSRWGCQGRGRRSNADAAGLTAKSKLSRPRNTTALHCI